MGRLTHVPSSAVHYTTKIYKEEKNTSKKHLFHQKKYDKTLSSGAKEDSCHYEQTYHQPNKSPTCIFSTILPVRVQRKGLIYVHSNQNANDRKDILTEKRFSHANEDYIFLKKCHKKQVICISLVSYERHRSYHTLNSVRALTIGVDKYFFISLKSL